MKFGDWWRQSAFAESHPDLYGICEAVWLASESYAVPEAEAPVAWAVRNVGGTLHSLTLTRETAEHNAKSLKQTVVPLYLQSTPQSDTPK